MEYSGIALIPVITGMVNVFKELGLPNKYAPLLSMIIGIIFSFAFFGKSNIIDKFFNGIIMGLSASGFYSTGKQIARSVRSIRKK